jgi:hypothetical protein
MYELCVLLLGLLVVGLLLLIKSSDNPQQLFDQWTAAIRRSWHKLLAGFLAVGVLWSVGFALWGGIGGLIGSAAPVALLFSLVMDNTRWVGHNAPGFVEAARRNRELDQLNEDASKITVLLLLPTIAWIIISLVLLCFISFKGYCPWPPR